MNPDRFLKTPSPMTVKDRLAENQCPRCGRRVIVNTCWTFNYSQFSCKRCGDRCYDDSSFEEIFLDPNPFYDERNI